MINRLIKIGDTSALSVVKKASSSSTIYFFKEIKKYLQLHKWIKTNNSANNTVAKLVLTLSHFAVLVMEIIYDN